MEEKELLKAARAYRTRLQSDPYRPAYHFAFPDGDGFPGDPNGCFYADGRYHLMYLYRDFVTDAYHWGHASSADLLHWRLHPDALAAKPDEQGYYSGGAFVDDDGTAYLSYWKLPLRDVKPGAKTCGIAIACARPPYEHWEESEPMALPVEDTDFGYFDLVLDGEIRHIGASDPSNIWKRDGFYYMQTGNLPVLNKYGREEQSPDIYRGDWTELFRSSDLRQWEYVGRFYENPRLDADWPDLTEDDMCPSFLPLYDAPSDGKPTGNYLQLFISHNKGAQYYIGSLEGERFFPKKHGRMTWRAPVFFAPEALVDDRNRQIMWAWLKDDPLNSVDRFGWCGVYSFPRVLWERDGVLHMAPAEELDRLQRHHQNFSGEALQDGIVPVVNGESFRIHAVWEAGRALPKHVGFRVGVSGDRREFVEVYVDTEKDLLIFDADTKCETEYDRREEAPFKLEKDEALFMDLFVDRSVVEVYVNERQAICRRAYAADPKDAQGVELIAPEAIPDRLDAWEMDAANFY